MTPIVVRGLDEANTALVSRLLEQLDNKSRRNRLRRNYYDGKRYVQRIGATLPAPYFRLAVVLGWSAKAVDGLARRCNLDGFEWKDGTLDDSIWTDNHFKSESNSAIVESLIHGVSFLINTQGDEAEDEPNSLIHVKTAFDATGDWDSRTRRMANLLSILSRDKEGKPNHMVLYLKDQTITMVNAERVGWVITEVKDHQWGVPVEAMVYKPRTSRPFGSSRISRPVMSLHSAALRTLVRMEGHADFYSIPQLWLLGASEDMFTNPDGTRASPWDVMFGRVKVIPDDADAQSDQLARADVKQFEASNPTPHIEFLKIQAQQFAAETSLPVTSLGLTELVNPTSADAYVASREDLIAEAEGADDDWEMPLVRAWARAHAMANDEPISDKMKTIKAIWRNPRYLSKAAEADAGAKIVSSAPEIAGTTVAYELLGLNPDQIKRIQKELEARNARQEDAVDQAAEGVRSPSQGGSEQVSGGGDQ